MQTNGSEYYWTLHLETCFDHMENYIKNINFGGDMLNKDDIYIDIREQTSKL